MEPFIQKHDAIIEGVLSTFDRVLIKGYLPLSRPEVMASLMGQHGLLLKDFKRFVVEQSAAVGLHAKALAERAGRPYLYLRGAVRKEEMARAMALRDGVEEGLIGVFGVVEACQSFNLAYGKGKPRLVAARRKCLCYYFYYQDPRVGFMHIRLQSWFPFVIQVYVNGHSWLERELTRMGVAFQSVENALIHVESYERAQRRADRMTALDWPRILRGWARQVNPHLRSLLKGMEYYWVLNQAEYATDLVFKDRKAFHRLYEKLLKHAVICFQPEEVMTFLGKKLDGRFVGELVGTLSPRPRGARIKHRVKTNWIKMYNKAGCILRVETVINGPYDFKVRRTGMRQGRPVVDWFPLPKGIAHLWRYAEIGHRANHRYLDALTAVEDPSAAYAGLEGVCERVRQSNRSSRGLNPLRKDDAALLAAVLNGAHVLRGFSSRDVAEALHLSRPSDPQASKAFSARLNRRLRLLRAHHLIARIPRTRRYRLTDKGTILIAALLYWRDEDYIAHYRARAA